MEFHRYVARIEFDDQANLFHGEVINIRDVITLQADSVDQMRKAFEDSVEDYLEFCAARGEKPNQPFTGLFTVRLSPAQHRRVIKAAEKMGKDIDAWVMETLERAATV